MGRIKRLKSVGRIVLALLVLCLTVPQVSKAAEDFDFESKLSEEARKAFALADEGDEAGAMQIFESGMKKGDPDCMAIMGYAYLQGDASLKIKKDVAQGLRLLTKAAELNSYYACLTLMRGYLAGNVPGVPIDHKKGLEYLTKLLDLEGESLAALMLLGMCYENGVYVERDPQTARSYYEKAQVQAQGQGNPQAEEKIKEMIYNLEHNPPDVFVGVSEFLQDYDENIIRANLKYSEKKARITGNIISIDSTPDGGACLVIGEKEDSQNAVACFFDKKHLEVIAALNKGQKVSVQGRVIKTKTELSVKDCWIAGIYLSF